jgi:hypothetical protein
MVLAQRDVNQECRVPVFASVADEDIVFGLALLFGFTLSFLRTESPNIGFAL